MLVVKWTLYSYYLLKLFHTTLKLGKIHVHNMWTKTTTELSGTLHVKTNDGSGHTHTHTFGTRCTHIPQQKQIWTIWAYVIVLKQSPFIYHFTNKYFYSNESDDTQVDQYSTCLKLRWPYHCSIELDHLPEFSIIIKTIKQYLPPSIIYNNSNLIKTSSLALYHQVTITVTSSVLWSHSLCVHEVARITTTNQNREWQ